MTVAAAAARVLVVLLLVCCPAFLTADVAASTTGSADGSFVTKSTADDQTINNQQDELSVLELLVAETSAEDSWAGAADAAYPMQSAAHQLATTGASSSAGHARSSTDWSSGSNSRNRTGSYRYSHTLQISIPQPWDLVNMSQIIRDNLEPDLRFWQNFPYTSTVQDVLEFAQTWEFTALPTARQLVEIHNNTLRFPLKPHEKQQGCDLQCDAQLAAFVQAMDDAVKVYNLTLPNVLFLLNTDDSSVCTIEMAQSRICRAPVISLSKQPYVVDLLGPVMKAEDSQVVHRHVPWAQKKNKAFFRANDNAVVYPSLMICSKSMGLLHGPDTALGVGCGHGGNAARGVPSCGEMPFPPRCARSWVARLAQTNYSELLDAGLVERYDRPDQIKGDPVLQDGHGPLPVLERVPISNISQFKWLLNLDGHVAAYRLAQLLASNSLVLKQQSSHHEYYYKSLHPYHHYVPILKHSEHDLVPRLKWAMAHEQPVHRIIRRANLFAMTYTTYQARILYWLYLLHGYAGLVAGMDDYFRGRDQVAAAAATAT